MIPRACMVYEDRRMVVLVGVTVTVRLRIPSSGCGCWLSSFVLPSDVDALCVVVVVVVAGVLALCVRVYTTPHELLTTQGEFARGLKRGQHLLLSSSVTTCFFLPIAHQKDESVCCSMVYRNKHTCGNKIAHTPRANVTDTIP